MKKFENLKVSLDETLKEKLELLSPNFTSYRILRESIDARRRGRAHKVYSVQVFEEGESAPDSTIELEKLEHPPGEKPIIVGTGPCGLFAALRLAERGIPSVILERGSPAQKRVLKINRYWRYGELDPDDNACFGEGGAGLYSDGKLITRIKSPHIKYVMRRLVEFGAPPEIEYLANPHVGSDKIRRLITPLRERLVELGCEIHFNERVTEVLCDTENQITGVRSQKGNSYYGSQLVLATGHSASDMFSVLDNLDVTLEGKSFALGLRIEHPQKLINKRQYREAADHPSLGAANYKLTHHDHDSSTGVYSFCMCPGGYVLATSTENGRLVCNGMSNYRRNSPFANSGIVITINHDQRFGGDLWGGLKLREKIEEDAFDSVTKAGGDKQLPAQLASDFLSGKVGETKKTSSPSGVVPARLDHILGEELTRKMAVALEKFESKIPGFTGPDAQLHGVESRTSCPIRVVRDQETLGSVSHPGLYPGGEGAGYAGGITSAAVDGIKIAEQIFIKLKSQPIRDSSLKLSRQKSEHE